MRRLSLFAVTTLLAASCGGSSSGGPGGSGGTTSSSGGSTGSGGMTSSSGGATSSSGGKTGSGGTTSSSGGNAGTGGAVGSGGSASASGGAVGTGGSSSGSGGMQASSGGSAVTGGANGSGGVSGSGGATGSGGRNASGGSTGSGGGAGGASTGGGGAGVPPASSFACNTVLGIDSTNEWFSGGFENEVPNAKWQIIYHHPGYISDWADTSDAVWSQAATSACTMDSDNPERVIFNAFADPSDSSYSAAAGWVTGMTKVVENLKKKYSNLKRVDLLTVTRGPNNMVCSGDSQMFSMIPSYVDDAIAMVVAKYPGFVTAAPKFTAPSCDDFDSSMKPPHLSTAGKPVMAKLYGDYYSMEP